MQRILITGGTGLLGKALIETNPSLFSIIATFVGGYEMWDSDSVCYKKIDIRDKGGYLKIFKEFKPEVVIHTASIGSPDFAEKNRELTWEVNVSGTEVICGLCGRFGSKLIHISSNGIYDGDNAPYAEKDEARPINYYGTTKLASENVVNKSRTIHAIVRPILMYGWPHSFERGNIVTMALSKIKSGEVMHVYADVYSNPLFSRSCAEAIWEIIRKDRYDTYNIAGRDILSIYELVKKATQVFGLKDDLVRPVKQGFFNELVKRPVNTSYNTEKMLAELGLAPLDIEKGLTAMRMGG